MACGLAKPGRWLARARQRAHTHTPVDETRGAPEMRAGASGLRAPALRASLIIVGGGGAQKGRPARRAAAPCPSHPTCANNGYHFTWPPPRLGLGLVIAHQSTGNIKYCQGARPTGQTCCCRPPLATTSSSAPLSALAAGSLASRSAGLAAASLHGWPHGPTLRRLSSARIGPALSRPIGRTSGGLISDEELMQVAN